MKVVIFAASGGSGRRLAEQALAAGQEVTAFAGDPAAAKINQPDLNVAITN